MMAGSGEMPERSKGVDSKSTVRIAYRGFESLSLRHPIRVYGNMRCDG